MDARAMDMQAAEIRHAFVKLGMQAGVSIAGIAFSATMLSVREGQEGIYLPLITAIIGFWLPSPRSPFKGRQPPPKTGNGNDAGDNTGDDLV